MIGSKSSLRDSGFSDNSVTMARTWPLPSADVKEEDDDPDECQACHVRAAIVVKVLPGMPTMLRVTTSGIANVSVGAVST